MSTTLLSLCAYCHFSKPVPQIVIQTGKTWKNLIRPTERMGMWVFFLAVNLNCCWLLRRKGSSVRRKLLFCSPLDVDGVVYAKLSLGWRIQVMQSMELCQLLPSLKSRPPPHPRTPSRLPHSHQDHML